jgi:two-component system nitrate/nitrite response regulator NarL
VLGAAPTQITRLEVADHHPIFRDALVRSLGKTEGVQLVAQAGEGAIALVELRRMRPDVAVLDGDLPGLDGPAITTIARREGLPTRILILADTLDGRAAHHALRCGAAGYVTRSVSAQELACAVRAVAAGGVFLPAAVLTDVAREIRIGRCAGRAVLSAREREILELVADDCGTDQIASRLHLSAATVKSHLRRAYDALGVRDRPAAVAVAMRLGLLE